MLIFCSYGSLKMLFPKMFTYPHFRITYDTSPQNNPSPGIPKLLDFFPSPCHSPRLFFFLIIFFSLSCGGEDPLTLKIFYLLYFLLDYFKFPLNLELHKYISVLYLWLATVLSIKCCNLSPQFITFAYNLSATPPQLVLDSCSNFQ